MYIDDHEENILDDPSLRPAQPEELPQGEAPAPEASATETAPEASATEPAPEAPTSEVSAPKKAKKKRMWPKVIAAALVCALLGGGAGVGGAALMLRWGDRGLQSGSTGTVIYQGTGTPVTIDLSQEEGRALSAAEVYASNANSVVGIITQVTTNIWGQRVSSAAAGSGFVLTQDGYIVTNNHVVKDADSIRVQFKNGDTFDARVVGSEEENDVAVLKIDATGLTPVRLGDSGSLVVGESVVAIGNPLGEMTFSMTHGIVSALDKALTMRDGSVINVLQTDAAINAGNSGGPLFNMYGQVIGITNAKYSNNGSTQASIEGICFAIPINDVKDLLTDIIEHGYVTGKPYAGVVLTTANADEAARYGRSGGAYVQEVVPDGPSAQAGLQAGDIITKMDDADVTSQQDFLTARDTHKAGDTVTLTVDRNGQFIQVPLTLGEQQPQTEEDADQSQEQTQTQTPNQGGGYGYGYSFDPFRWFGW